MANSHLSCTCFINFPRFERNPLKNIYYSKKIFSKEIFSKEFFSKKTLLKTSLLKTNFLERDVFYEIFCKENFLLKQSSGKKSSWIKYVVFKDKLDEANNCESFCYIHTYHVRCRIDYGFCIWYKMLCLEEFEVLMYYYKCAFWRVNYVKRNGVYINVYK